jgi:hypothetical protein
VEHGNVQLVFPLSIILCLLVEVDVNEETQLPHLVAAAVAVLVDCASAQDYLLLQDQFILSLLVLAVALFLLPVVAA